VRCGAEAVRGPGNQYSGRVGGGGGRVAEDERSAVSGQLSFQLSVFSSSFSVHRLSNPQSPIPNSQPPIPFPHELHETLHRTCAPDLGQANLRVPGLPLGRAVMGNFPDGEISCKIDEDVRGRDVFLLQPTCPPVNENLMELLIMIESFKRASADRITAVIPYYGYARQDRKDEGRVPITAKLVANLITRAGADRVLAMDLHTAQIQGFSTSPWTICMRPGHRRTLQGHGLCRRRFRVVSPDEGSIKRALAHMARLGGHLAIIDKRRSTAEKPSRPTSSAARWRAGGLDLRRHDQHGRLDLRRGRGHAPARRPTGFLGRHARAVGGRGHRAVARGPHRRADPDDTIPLPPEKQIPKITVLASPLYWVKRSSGSTGTNRQPAVCVGSGYYDEEHDKMPSCGSAKIKKVRRKWSGQYKAKATPSKTSNSTNVPTAKSGSTTPRRCGPSRPTRRPSPSPWRQAGTCVAPKGRKGAGKAFWGSNRRCDGRAVLRNTRDRPESSSQVRGQQVLSSPVNAVSPLLCRQGQS